MFEDDDDDMDEYMSALPDEVMTGSQPLPSTVDLGPSVAESLPTTILENIFSNLPISDMNACREICVRWNDIVSDNKFLPWKKNYYQCRRTSVCADLDELILYVTTHQNKMYHFCAMIRFVAYHEQKTLLKHEREKLLEIINNHPCSSVAKKIVNSIIKPTFKEPTGDVKNFPTLQVFDVVDDVWYLLPMILLLCTTPEKTYSFVISISTVLPLTQSVNLIYFLMTILWTFYKKMGVCIQEHSKLLYVTSKIESSSFSSVSVNNTNGKPSSATMNPTPEQMKVIQHRFQRNHLLRVMAFAGTGKTTTLVHLVRANPSLSFLYTSFSKAVIDQAYDSFASSHNVKVSTFHSLAYRGMNMLNFRDKLYRGTLYLSQIREQLKIKDPITRKKDGEEDYPFALCVRNTLFSYMASADMRLSISHVQLTVKKLDKDEVPQNVPLPNHVRQEIFKLSERYWNNMVDMNNLEWKMSDDCYLKLWQLSKPEIIDYDVIMLDEAQDLTDCMLDIVKRQMPHCSLVFVGDPHQSIYGFRRARNALSKPIFPRTTYHLTQSFRFGYEIASVADAILRELKYPRMESRGIKFADDKTLLGVGSRGKVTGKKEDLFPIAYLCRTNVGVVLTTLDIIGKEENAGKKVVIIGGPQKLGLSNLMDLYAMSKTPEERQKQNLICKKREWKRHSNLADIKREAKMNEDMNLLTQIEIVEKLKDRIPESVKLLKKLPRSYVQSDISVGTIHQAKGLEFDNVVISEFPSVCNQLPYEDINLLYVAVTRAKKTLVINGSFYKALSKWNIIPWTPKPSNEELPNYFCAMCKQMKDVEFDLVIEIGEIPKFQDKGIVCTRCIEENKTGWTALLELPGGKKEDPVIND